MIAKKHLVLIAVGACILGLSVLGSEKNPVERPFKGYCQATALATVDGNGNVVSMESVGEGNFTHMGLVTMNGEGYLDESGILLVDVTLTAANGDQVFYTALDPINLVITGGTGRFKGATGTVTEDVEMVFGPGPSEGTITIDMTGIFEGTITY